MSGATRRQADKPKKLIDALSQAVVELTGTEFRLLRYLMSRPDRLLSKHQLTEHIYDGESDRDSNELEVYVRRLREKIGRERIETRRGQGYLFRSQP